MAQPKYIIEIKFAQREFNHVAKLVIASMYRRSKLRVWSKIVVDSCTCKASFVVQKGKNIFSPTRGFQQHNFEGQTFNGLLLPQSVGVLP